MQGFSQSLGNMGHPVLGVPIATAAAAADRAGSVWVCVTEGEEQVSAEMGEDAVGYGT